VMVSHKEFETAGKKPGLQVWRIENMDLKPVPKELHGSFYMGDAYLLLFTTAAPSYYIHMWMGDECSQDESGAAAVFATQLDDFLGGGPVQFRETQNYESNTFQGYFKKGIKYQIGGVASGFQHVVTNDASVKRLLHVKGRRIIRASEVELSWSSFNKGDCFIIDLGKDIYQWCGSECNRFERLKASQLSIGIRDDERNGRAKVHMVEEGDEPEAVLKVLGPKTSIAPTAEQRSIAVLPVCVCSLQISDASGSMKVTSVAPSSPFKQGMLSPEECYILDNGVDRTIFVWKGPKANVSERKAAMAAGQQFIKDKGYSSKTQIQVLPAGGETPLFKQFFSDWKDKDQTTGPTKTYTIGRIAQVEQVPFDAATLHSNSAMAAQHGMVDDGKGKVQVRVGEKDREKGNISTGMVQVFPWIPPPTATSTAVGRSTSSTPAFLTVKLDDSMGGAPVQVRVTQGQEPPHLMSLFQGKPMIIHLGGTSRKVGQQRPPSTRLFHIRQSMTRTTRVVEVEATASNLNTNDVFVLKTVEHLFVWRGLGATDEEMDASNMLCSSPANFWSALGGKKEYQTSKSLRNMVKPPRLFGCSNKIGRLIVEEVPGDFTQSDLATDDVMLLDTWDQIFLWVGKDANEVERKGAPKIAKEYVDSDPAGRSGLPITTIKQGAEPPTFTGWFQAWDPKMWDTDPLERIRARF
uniref:Adseverin-like n=1 Tax=Salarias fasciatus TaxID=181472 RepID=A0A672J6U6_SALFA